jgi:hypothetical protein
MVTRTVEETYVSADLDGLSQLIDVLKKNGTSRTTFKAICDNAYANWGFGKSKTQGAKSGKVPDKKAPKEREEGKAQTSKKNVDKVSALKKLLTIVGKAFGGEFKEWTSDSNAARRLDAENEWAKMIVREVDAGNNTRGGAIADMIAKAGLSQGERNASRSFFPVIPMHPSKKVGGESAEAGAREQGN